MHKVLRIVFLITKLKPKEVMRIMTSVSPSATKQVAGAAVILGHCSVEGRSKAVAR